MGPQDLLAAKRLPEGALTPPDIRERVWRLSKSELALFFAAANGSSNREIAMARGTRESTVKNQLRGVNIKLGCKSRIEYPLIALQALPPKSEVLPQQVSIIGETSPEREFRESSMKLTKVERILLPLLLEGLSYEEIAHRRGRAVSTTKLLCSRLFRKLGVTRKTLRIAFQQSGAFENAQLLGDLDSQTSLAASTNEEFIRSRLSSLSQKENQVLSLLLKGYSTRDIARELSRTEKTVSTHLTNLYSKLHIRSKQELLFLTPPTEELERYRTLLSKLTPLRYKIAELMAMGVPREEMVKRLQFGKSTLARHQEQLCELFCVENNGRLRSLFAALFSSEQSKLSETVRPNTGENDSQ